MSTANDTPTRRAFLTAGALASLAGTAAAEGGDLKYGTDRSKYGPEDVKHLNAQCRAKESTLAKAGAGKKFAGRFYDVPHQFTRAMQDDAFAWLDEHLGHKGDEP